MKLGQAGAKKSRLKAVCDLCGNAEKPLAHLRGCVGGKLPLRILDVKEEGVGDTLGSFIVKSGGRPLDTRVCWRPDPAERALMWEGEPPPIDYGGHREVYDMNKELANYLSGRIAVEMPGRIVKLANGYTLRYDKHRA